MSLRTLSPLPQDFVVAGARLGVSNALILKDFEFPVLLNESNDSEEFALDRGAVTGSEQGCPLCQRYISWSGT